MSLRSLLVCVVCWFAASVARADAERFALIVGNNAGDHEDIELRYAESDADKVHTLLRELGGFEPANMLLLKGEDAETVRRTLVALNDRIRSSVAAGHEALLVVYYSGHADARALRLGTGRLDLTELAQLVRGSSATFRLLAVDACRSGMLTRVKGGHVVPPFFVPTRSLASEGMAFLTASAASEDAQESDDIGGSLFTHAFVSGLMGAADADGDAAVSLDEAYRYAYDATLRATSRTVYGVQHPTFQYEFRGQGSLVLTRLRAAAGTRATLRFPGKLGFLLMRDGADGKVVAELSAQAEGRTLSLRPGTYYVRGRGEDSLLEGQLKLAAGEDRTLDPNLLERVRYARLVRKGAGGPGWAHSVDLGMAVQSYFPAASTPCFGSSGGYRLDLPHVSLAARAGVCHSSFQNSYLRGATNEYDLGIAGLYTFDLALVSLGFGIGAGVVVAHQRFESNGFAPDRTSSAPFAALIADVSVELSRRIFMRFDARSTTQLVPLREEVSGQARLQAVLSVRAALMIGMYLGQGIARD